MSQTLVEASKYSNDVLQKGVVELLVKDDPILERLPFKTIKGNGLTYNQESTLSSAQFYEVGDTWVESTSVVAQATAVTKILGGDADVDNFLRATRGNEQDLMSEQIKAKTKAIKRTYLDAFFYGYFTGGNTKDFDGLQYLIRRTTSGSENTIGTATSSGTSIVLSLERGEAAKDLIKLEEPDVVVMSKLLRRYINKYLNGVGGITKTDIQGQTVQTLFEIPVVVSDHIRNNESADLQYGTNEASTAVYGHNYADGAGDDDDGGTTMFFLKFADEACSGIQSLGITTDRIGKLETKDAERVRIKWYPGLMLQNLVSCSKVTGIDADGTVTA
jgi:hypothetical protein